MYYKSEDAFAKDVKENGVRGLCFLYSTESWLVESWRRSILARFGGEDGFNLQKLDGRKPDLDALYDATQMLPLFSEEKCVLLDDYEGKPSAGELEKFAVIFEELPPECTLLITARPPRFDPKSASGKKLMAAAASCGMAVELPARDTAGMVKFLQRTAKQHGCEISAALCRDILRRGPTDMNALAAETAKLCAYAGGGELRPEHVERILTPRVEARAFDLGKAILAGNTQRALEIIDELFYLREPPVTVLNALAMNYVDLYRARAAKDAGATPQDVITRFGYKGREFRVNAAFGVRLSKRALRRSLTLLADCDRALKSTSADDRMLLERTVIGLIAAREDS